MKNRQIVNIINFIRGVEPREEVDLLEPVLEQIKLMKKHNLKGTFLLQYDALILPEYSSLLKSLDSEQFEIGVWHEVVEPMVKKAGIAWRGRFPWDWHAHCGFPVGYTKEEREKLIDILFEDFREIMGYYPRVFGSWLFDSHTIRYAHSKYGLDAVCNCKEQYGTGDNNDRVENVTYANGLTITYAYDESGNIIGISYDGGATYAYEYQYGDGALTLLRDNINGQTTYYSDDGYSIYVTPVDEGAEETLLYTCTYDEDGNFIETTGDATYAHVFEDEQYDKATGETIKVYTIQDRTGLGTTESPYVYGSAFDITVTDVSDYFGRAKQRVVKNVSGETTKFQMTTTYEYYSRDDSLTSELLTSYNNTISADDYTAKDINYTYSYDNNGNITEIRQNGTLTNKYYYDEAGQVIREDWAQQEKTITYSYDNGGNITSKNEYAYTDSDVLGEVVTANTFSYSNSPWKDQLTSVNGDDITYDALGNPVSYGDDITYTWNGRQLLEYKNSNPDDYIRCVYTYDTDGLRTRKLVYRQKSSSDTTEYLAGQYDYVWKDGILDSENYICYDKNGAELKTVVYKYFYDEYNSPIGIALWVDGEKNGNYWYIKNAQGDVTAVYCEGAGIVVNYNYDAYGNMKAVAGENGLAGAIVMILYNSITYRGYYFDIDTNMYYLQSRYYSPVWGRFINADDVEYLGVSGTSLGYNLYAYCENDPVDGYDPYGYYNRTAACNYAKNFAKIFPFNPLYYYYPNGDCANFVSQCLYAGGIKMTSSWYMKFEKFKWKRSNSWALAENLRMYFLDWDYMRGVSYISFYNDKMNGFEKGSESYIDSIIGDLKKGDLLFMDFTFDKKSKFTHATIITGLQTTGTKDILYSAHTSRRYNASLKSMLKKGQISEICIIYMRNDAK